MWNPGQCESEGQLIANSLCVRSISGGRGYMAVQIRDVCAHDSLPLAVYLLHLSSFTCNVM